jgi:hypothetical protein
MAPRPAGQSICQLTAAVTIAADSGNKTIAV